jgi:AraC-like DNA-binding protein
MPSFLTDFGLGLGFLLVLRLLIFSRKSNPNSLFLALSLFCLWYGLLIHFLNETRLIFDFPHLFRTGLFLAYLVGPFLYVYVRNSFYPGILWKRTDWLFLLPALFYVIDLFPFFISSRDYKMAILRSTLDFPSKYFGVKEGWIALNGFHFAFVYVWDFIIQVLVFRMLIRNLRFRKGMDGSLNKRLFWFLVVITICFLPLTVPGLAGILLHLNWFTLKFIGVSLTIDLLATTLYLFFYPDIQLGFGPRSAAEARIRKKEARILKRVDYLEPVAKLEKFMNEKRVFLDRRCSIHSLAGEIGIPVYQLSAMINQYYNSNFNSWINKYRIDYFIGLWQQEDNRDLTMDALALQSGFSSRTSFINAFKKEKNTTPSKFLKKS